MRCYLTLPLLFAVAMLPQAHAAPGDIIFEEAFNNNGDFVSDWSDSGSGDASVTGETFSSASNSLRIGEGSHTVTLDSGLADLSSVPAADLNVWVRRGDDLFSENPDSGEDLTIEYLNSSSSWVSLVTYPGNGSPGEELTPSFSLPANALHAGFQIRFRLLSGSGNPYDYWHIDDVVVTEGTPITSCQTYIDSFSSTAYNNSNGTADWTGFSWIELNDDSSASGGNALISGNELRLSGNGTLNNTTITRQLDGSSSTEISFSFDFTTAGSVDTADSAIVQVSSNGGSTWTTLETLTGIGNNVSGSRSYDISAYASSNLQVRFAISPESGGDCCYDTGGERLEIDNVEVEVCTTNVPDPVAWYRLDEEEWTGASGEVVDSSASGYDGEAINDSGYPPTDDSDPAIAGNPGTCGYGVFNDTDDGYLQIDAPGSVLDFNSNFSVAVWIYPFSNPGSGLHTIVSKDENFEFHLNSSGRVFWWWGGGSRSLTSSSSVTLNAWNHLAITYESGNQVIYINGASVGTNNSTAAITLNNDDLFIGTDIAFHSRRFDGRIDEVKVYDETLNAQQINVVMNETHACANAAVDHYAISHSGSSLICDAAAETVSIVAHDGGHTPVDASNRVIQITATSSTPGWTATDSSWALAAGQPGSLTVTGPGVAEYTFGGTSQTGVDLWLTNSSEADIDIDVVDLADSSITDVDGDNGPGGEDQIISFVSTGLLFYDDSDTDGNRDPIGGGFEGIQGVLVAGDSSNQLILRAVVTNDETGTCEGLDRASGGLTVNIGYECVNPTFCHAGQDMSINGTPIAQNDSGNVVSFSPVNLSFDADAEAPFTMQYFDVGEVRLHAQLSLPADAGDPAITLTGSSDSTIVRPAQLVITRIEAPDGTANPGTTTTGDGFVPSDSVFTVEVEARNSAGRVAYSYGFEIPPESVTLSATNLVMPSAGDLPALTNAASFVNDPLTPGVHLNTGVRWPEAGAIQIQAEIADGDYLGTGLNTVSAESGTVGRFYPSLLRFASGSVTDACVSGNFTYMSDSGLTHTPADLSLNIEALSANNIVLANYDDTYPTTVLSLDAENDNDGSSLSARLTSTNPGGAWADGVYQIIGTENLGFSRLLSGINEIVDGPYHALQIGVISIDPTSDGIDFATSDLNFDSDTSGDCSIGATCNSVSLGELDLRFGRLYGENVHGPESAAIAVPLLVEYWNGTEFVTNISDNCTQIAVSDIQFDGSSLSTDANRIVTIGAGTTTGTFANYTLGSDFTFSSGDAGLMFSAPGIGNTGQFNVDIDLTNYPWLTGDWDNNGNYANDTALPSLEIEFGRYRGHDRIIYWEEQLR